MLLLLLSFLLSILSKVVPVQSSVQRRALDQSSRYADLSPSSIVVVVVVVVFVVAVVVRSVRR